MTTTASSTRATTPDAPTTRTMLRVAAVLVLSGAAGIVLICVSYAMAASSSSGMAYAHVFWGGNVLLVGPLGDAILRGAVNEKLRVCLVAAAGLAAYVPHFLRAPKRPYMNDELAHYLQAENMFRTGKLFLPNPIVTQAKNYPGFETLTTGLRGLTGLGTYQVGCLVIALAHIATVLALYQLARLIVSPQVAGVAALIYAVGPQFGLVDSIYAYESLGLPLAVGAIAMAATALRETLVRRRTVDLAATTLLLVACIFTHHLSSFACLTALAVLTIGGLVWPVTRTARAGAVALGTVTAAGWATAVAWSIVRGAHIGSYLSVYVSNGWQSLLARVGIQSKGTQLYNGYTAVAAGRTPLSGADKPGYEIAATYATPLLLLAFAAWALWRARPARNAVTLLVVVFTVLYFVSLPLLFAAGGQNAAHRSWSFTLLGLSILAAAGLDSVMRLPVRRSDRRAPAPAAPARSVILDPRTLAATIGILVLLIGGHGAGVNTLVAYPGKFVFQSDGRNVPRELYSLADWIRVNEGRDRTVLADYRTSVVLATIGGENPSTGLASELILPAGPPPPDVIEQVRTQADFVVVDHRLTSDVSSQGYYFWQYEQQVAQPLPRRSLAKLANYGWLKVIHRTTHYTVYEVTR